MDIPDECEFIVEKQDQAQLKTQTNGDTLIFRDSFSQEQATILAWMVNSRKKLQIKVEMLEENLEE